MILLTCLMSSGCGVPEKLSDVVTSVTKTATQDEFEQVIDVVLYQQLYYDNALLEEFAQKAVLKTTAPVLATHLPYCYLNSSKKANGGLLYYSDKKLLRARIKDNLLFLSTCGYINYEDLKKIADKLADLQEKSTYKIVKTQKKQPLLDDENWTEKGFEEYAATVRYPDCTKIAKTVLKNTEAELNAKFNVHGIFKRSGADDSLGELQYQSQYQNLTPEQLQQYGDIILKNYQQVLNEEIPFTTHTFKIHIKKGKSEDKESDRVWYLLPDGDVGLRFIDISGRIWSEFGYFTSRNYNISSSVYLAAVRGNNVEDVAKIRFYNVREGSSLNQLIEAKIKEFGLQSKKEKEFPIVNNLQELDDLLDRREQLYNQVVPLIFEESRKAGKK